GSSPPTTWGRVFACLVAAGHQRDQLGRYTERQLMLFFREAEAEKGRQQARELMAVNHGFAGGSVAIAAYDQLMSN
ncbi:hypothetical protein ACWXZL_33990, partial [Pseudomonas aeruginosa]